MNSAKYIEIFKNGQKEGIRDVTVKRKLQTVMTFGVRYTKIKIKVS